MLGIPAMTGLLRIGDDTLWVEQRGQGPDVLLICGLADSVEVWAAQLDALSDRYRITTFDNRGVGRSPLPRQAMTVASMADDADAVLRALRIPSAHVAGYSGGSAVAQELALRHPDRVRSLALVSTWARADAYFTAMLDFWHWLVDRAPSERAMLEAFYLWIYTPRAHADGTVQRFIDETLSFSHKQSSQAFQAQLAAFRKHDTFERLPAITAPTLVIASELDRAAPPHLGRSVADRIPGARFEVLAGEAHQPFQEAPDLFNARVAAFWRAVDAARSRERASC